MLSGWTLETIHNAFKSFLSDGSRGYWGATVTWFLGSWLWVMKEHIVCCPHTLLQAGQQGSCSWHSAVGWG
jgi:hypothetical protein